MDTIKKVANRQMDEKFYVQSIHRALRIIDEISKDNSRGFNLSELAQKIKLPVSTVYRIIQNLVAWEYVKEKENGNYILGFGLLRLGNVVKDNLDIRTYAIKYMDELNEKTKETIYLSILDRDKGEIIYIEKEEGHRSVKMAAGVGTRNYIHSTANGKCLVSGLSDDKITELINKKGMPSLTDKTIVSLPEFFKEIKRVRSSGYAIDDVENEPGVRCIAAPIVDYVKNVVAAVCVSGSVANIGDEIVDNYSNLVKETALKISFELGYRID